MPAPARQIHSGAPARHWRVLIAVPPAGFGRQLAIMHAWLDQHCGPESWAAAPAGTGGVLNDAIALYFVNGEAAQAFVRRFSCGYRVGH